MPHDHDHDHGHDHHVGPGHNGHRHAAQWQTPHLPGHDHEHGDDTAHEPDLDLVEAAFIEGFTRSSDPTSFLRLSGVPFDAEAGDGTRLTLLRVETGTTTDIGLLTPQLGGEGFRYAPLPAKLVEMRNALKLVYHDGVQLVSLTLAEARALGGAS